METSLLTEVIETLPRGKTHYRYFKNRYAPSILSMAMDGATTVRAVKASHLGSLLDNPSVKSLLATRGDGILYPHQLEMIWQEPSESYLLTLAHWKYQSRGWSQVSRSGDNLVLQLNLPKFHQRMYEKHVGSTYWFNPMWGHPIQRHRGQLTFRDTLAWSRIDFSFDTDEALIEEVQSDAVREMGDLAKQVKNCHYKDCRQCRNTLTYLKWFENHKKLWSEAMLLATIEFIRNELGIRRIFTHTHRSGWRVKRMSKDDRPPRSLYSSLPTRFGFKRLWNAPAFILQTRSYHRLIRQRPDIDFFMLDFTQSIQSIGSKQQSGERDA